MLNGESISRKQDQIKWVIHQISFPISFALAEWLPYPAAEFYSSPEKASTDLAGIRVQDDPTADAHACPVHDRGAFKLVRAGCVLHVSSCFHTKVKAVGSICSLFLHYSDLKVVGGTRKWAQRVSHELHVDGIWKNHSSFKVNHFLSCLPVGLFLHKLFPSWWCK